eukprot:jgi/Psemu1/36076/gm1.36076_g
MGWDGMGMNRLEPNIPTIELTRPFAVGMGMHHVDVDVDVDVDEFRCSHKINFDPNSKPTDQPTNRPNNQIPQHFSTMMKFLTTALALVAASPIASVSANYQCESDTSFVMADAVAPSKEALEFLADAMKESFNEAYKRNPDVTMISDESEGFDSKPDLQTVVTNLRGNNDKPNLGEWVGSWYGTYVAKMYIGCNLCEVDDDMLDTTAAFLGGSDLALALNTAAEHSSWEKLFCEKVHKLEEFASMTGCAIHLTNCETTTEDGADEEEHENFVEQAAKLVKNLHN